MTPEKSRRVLNLQQRSALAGEAAAAAAEVETALATPADPSVAAFFDVDNTMMQGASIFHLARGLHRREFFTTREILSAAWKQAYFRIVGVEDPEHVAETRASALSFVAGHTVVELVELGEEIYDEAMADRIWPGTRALAQMHLDEGERVWLVTAAPIEIARIIARRLGLTGALGTVAEHEDGVYTGPARRRDAARPGEGGGDQGAGRAREGLDLDRCSAYSDSFNDLPHAVAGRTSVRREPRRPAASPSPSTRAGASVTTAPDARRPRSASSRPRWPAPPPEPWPQAWPYADDGDRDPARSPVPCRRPCQGSPDGSAPDGLRAASSSWYSVCWIVSRTWSVRLNTSIGSSAAPSAVLVGRGSARRTRSST